MVYLTLDKGGGNVHKVKHSTVMLEGCNKLWDLLVTLSIQLVTLIFICSCLFSRAFECVTVIWAKWGTMSDRASKTWTIPWRTTPPFTDSLNY